MTESSLMVVVHLPGEQSRSIVAATHCVTSSSGESSDERAPRDEQQPTRPRAKRLRPQRKSVYNARREEIAELREVAGALETQLHHLRAKHPLYKPVATYTMLRQRVTQNRIALAGVEPLATAFGLHCDWPPLSNYIHLPIDPLDRQRVLDGLHTQQIQDATAFILARCQTIDLESPTCQVETHEAANGDHVAVLWKVAQLRHDQPTVRRVFDALLAYSQNREMVLAERLGLLSVRESDVSADISEAAEARVLYSHDDMGLLVEQNIAVHSQYRTTTERLQEPHGIIVLDTVDRDDAFPYTPSERIRQDLYSVTLVRPSVKPSGVVLVKWAFARIHKSALATSDQLAAVAQLGQKTCFEAMMHTVHEQLAAYRRTITTCAAP